MMVFKPTYSIYRKGKEFVMVPDTGEGYEGQYTATVVDNIYNYDPEYSEVRDFGEGCAKDVVMGKKVRMGDFYIYFHGRYYIYI